MTGIDVSTTERLSGARFREARQSDWFRLERLLARIERGNTSALSDEDLFELPVLYRATLSSLSVARETSLDADLIAYLESLSTRAYFILYGVHAPFLRRLGAFFAIDWPQAARALWRETLIALLLTLAAAAAAWLLVQSDPSWYYAIVPEGMSQGRDPTASAVSLRKVIYHGSENFAGTFAASLFTHNSQISILCFALGFLFGVPTVLLLIYNGCMLGAMLAVHFSKGLGWQFAAWIAIHGTTEIFAIILAAAAGLRIGMAVAFPGRATRVTAAIAAGRTAALAMLGVVVMLAVAGVLEGIGRQAITDDIARASIGGVMLLGWLLYFYIVTQWRAPARG